MIACIYVYTMSAAEQEGGPRIVDYRTLRYILAVAQERNISKAARKLHISQPSLSHCILKQERQLGVSLFDRTAHPLRLTYAGENYVKAAQQILHVKEQLEEEMKGIAETKKGRLSIGMTKPRSAYLLPQVLPYFCRLYPNVEIVLTEENVSTLESLLIAEKVEIAILLSPIENEHFTRQHLFEEEILLCLPEGHPLVGEFRNEGADLRRLEREPFILYQQGQRVRRATDLFFAQSGFKPHVILESQLAETILGLVSVGMGCALIPKSVLKYSGIQPKPYGFTLGNPPISSEFVFAWKRDARLSWVAQEFMSATRYILEQEELGEYEYTQSASGENRIFYYPPKKAFRPE